MKKTSLIFAGIILILLVCTYVCIPGELRISDSVIIRATEGRLEHFVGSRQGWKAWWPGDAQKSSSYSYRDDRYTVEKVTNQDIQVGITTSEMNAGSRIVISPVSKDSMEIRWLASFPSSSNPVKRLQQYRASLELKNNINEILNHLQVFFNDEAKVYGIRVSTVPVKNLQMVSIRIISTTYPRTDTVYRLISKLRQFIVSMDAKETDFPMLNVNKTAGNKYEIMVAIPVNKVIPATGNIALNRMVKGNLLVTEVKGGPQTIQKTFNRLEEYMRDKRLTAPARPYEMLISNRLTVPDTSQWITRIYYPVL